MLKVAWKRFTAMPDMGRWHRYLLKKEALLRDQREHAPESPYESDRHRDAVEYLKQHRIRVKALRL